jgi:O-antigen/teichoic acid export membrane protein
MSLQSPPKTDNPNPSAAAAGSEVVDLFDTAYLMDDIKGRSVKGGAVTIGSQAVKFILHTGSTAILARILTPADFGLIVMVAAFTEFVNLFKDLGLSMATIQKKKITHQQVSNLFWVNVAMSLFLMLVAAAISPFVAWFYGEPRLMLITIAIGSTFIFGGLIAQHTALMRRQMRFFALEIVEISATTAGIAAAIIAALSNLSYWSLVIMMAVRGLAGFIMIWSLNPWRPGRPVRGSGVWSMLAFGGNLTGAKVLDFVTRNGDNVIIGYALGSASLGIYSKAYNLLELPMAQISSPLYNVMVPALCRLQAEPARYRRFYLQSLAAVAVITMPIVVFCFVSADEIVHIILGSQWTAAVATFRWLGPAVFLTSISFAPGWLFTTMGQAGTQFRWTILSAPITIIGFLIGIHWGINGIAASFSITYSVLFLLCLALACSKSPVSFYDIIQTLAVPTISSLLAAFGAVLVGRFVLESNAVIRLAIYGLAFAVCYFACVMATFTGRQLVRSILIALYTLR